MSPPPADPFIASALAQDRVEKLRALLADAERAAFALDPTDHRTGADADLLDMLDALEAHAASFVRLTRQRLVNAERDAEALAAALPDEEPERAIPVAPASGARSRRAA